MKALTAVRILWRAFARTDEAARFVLLERLSAALLPELKLPEEGRLWLRDGAFLALYERLEGRRNYRSLDRKYTLDQLARLVRSVPGDTAECGVFRGTSSYLICRALAGTGKAHHVFDSFAGLSAPAAADGPFWHAGDLCASEEEVRATLSEFKDVHTYRGWIPDRFAAVSARRFAFVHVDVDLYQPTRDALAFFYPRLAPGGILVCDDHGFASCPGARTAWQEVLGSAPEATVALTTGQAFLIRARD